MARQKKILLDNALVAWANAIRYCDQILAGKITLEVRKNFVSSLHNAVELFFKQIIVLTILLITSTATVMMRFGFMKAEVLVDLGTPGCLFRIMAEFGIISIGAPKVRALILKTYWQC